MTILKNNLKPWALPAKRGRDLTDEDEARENTRQKACPLTQMSFVNSC